jgi:hypothetical protein
MKNRINTYTCKTCRNHIVTEDVNVGTTPMMLACRATPGCSGSMLSGMYKVDQTLVPTHEWYKPAKLPKEPGMREHVKMGGLMLREK